MSLRIYDGRTAVRNLLSALISLLLGIFFTVVWLTTLFYDSQSIGETSVLLGILGLPMAAAFFVWLSYRTLLQKRAGVNPMLVKGSSIKKPICSLKDVQNSHPDDFLQIMTRLLERLGYTIVTTSWSDSSTLEMSLEKDNRTELARCFQTLENIPLMEVTEFMDRIAASGLSRGYLISTGHFTLASREATLGKGLYLVDGEELAEMLAATYPS